MAKYSFNKEEFEAWKRAQQESADLQQKLNTSMKDYLATVKQIGELQKNIKYIEQQRNKLTQEYVESAQEVRKNWKELIDARKRGDADEIKALKNKDTELRKILASKKKGLDITEHELEILKKQTAELTEQVKQTNKLSLGFNTITNSLGAVPGLISKGFGMLKGTGIFEMDKEIRNAVRSMAGGQKTYDTMAKTFKEIGDRTVFMGVGLKDLAVMQQGYSEAIGRSVMLTEAGAKAMADIAEGTGLGKEFAVELAAGMDNFNISAERSGKLIEDNMNVAAKLGVNGAAAMKAIQNNLKLAQKYNFKGGIAGLAKFSVEATKLKIDLDGIAGMVDKVFRPEGAIEMAAELATMGGNFAALGDPMQLMFKARNDFEGFSRDIARASGEFVEMNKQTGEFTIKNGLAADRMREISRITGISVEKLQEMATQEAKIQEIRKNANPLIKEDDMMMLESFAKYEKGKGFVVNIDGKDKLIKDLRENDLEFLRAEEKTLEKRAEDARTFDETLQDLILMFKQQLFPFAKTLKEEFGDKIIQLGKWFASSEFKDLLNGLIKKLQGFIEFLGDWVNDNPVKAGIVAGTALFGGVLSKAAMWMANGVALGMGFNSVASVGGGSILDMLGGKGGKGASRLFNTSRRGLGMSRMGQFGMNLRGASGSLGAIGGGVLSAGFAGYDEWTENAALGMGTGENIGRTGAKATGAGLGAWGGAATGAAIGSVVPIIGTAIGGIIGGIVGGIAGSEFGETVSDAIWGDERATASDNTNYYADYSKVRDGIMFHPNDKFMKVNDGITIAGTSTSGNNKLAQELGGSSMSGDINHSFKDLNIKISVDAPSNSEFWETVINQPDIMRRITEAVHISTEEAASGKISGKPKRKFA